ncbi:MAG: hypothetical protein JST21_12865 [Bacteroidetes bacterium]|nr:hypothetical protein [Bacteroidota bacterium]
MKLKHSLFAVTLLISCSKQKDIENVNRVSTSQDDAIIIDPYNVPIDVIGTSTYNDSIGGLYPDGSNVASGTYADDLFATSQSIEPLDTFGNPSSAKSANILFISLGGSTGGHNMKNLKSKTTGNPLTNPKLKLVSCNNGSGTASLNSMMNPNSDYWDHVTRVITGNKTSYRQVQIMYLETDDTSRIVTWPERPNLVRNVLESCLRVFKQKFPNLKVVYTLARTRTFHVSALWNREPSPYYYGWASKWAIQDQINGVPGTEYKGENAVAPMLAWGFYQWADSTPRPTDGFYWIESETADGLHASSVGEDTLTYRFQNFLLTDKNTSLWYANHGQ